MDDKNINTVPKDKPCRAKSNCDLSSYNNPNSMFNYLAKKSIQNKTLLPSESSLTNQLRTASACSLFDVDQRFGFAFRSYYRSRLPRSALAYSKDKLKKQQTFGLVAKRKNYKLLPSIYRTPLS